MATKATKASDKSFPQGPHGDKSEGASEHKIGMKMFLYCFTASLLFFMTDERVMQCLKLCVWEGLNNG